MFHKVYNYVIYSFVLPLHFSLKFQINVMMMMFDWIFHFKLNRKNLGEGVATLSLEGSTKHKIPLEFLIYDILDDLIVRDSNFVELNFNIKISSALKTKDIQFSFVCDFLSHDDEKVGTSLLEKLNNEIKLHSFEEFCYIKSLNVQITGRNEL